jgi:predicted amidohydrolase YtcJ
VLYGMGPYLLQVLPELGRSELDRGIQLANDRFISLGITSVQDASVSSNMKRWKMYQEWKEQGYFKPRVSMMMGTEYFDEFCEQGFTPRLGDEWLRLGGVKIILRETTGELHPNQEELNKLVFKIHKAGHQAVLHVVEESMLKSACLAFDYALNTYFDRGHRHRLEHCSVCSPAMVENLTSLKTVIVTQPSFIYYNGERYLSMVDEYQLRHLYPIGRLMKAGLKLAAGSDCPVVPLSPLVGIYAAVSRLSEAGISILPDECISPVEALSMYTTNAAYACFEEDKKGSLVPGKLADLVVLDNDPTHMPVSEIKDMEVKMTVIGGEVVWRNGL